MGRPQNVHATDRRRELHEQATAAGIANPASLALALAAAEGEGWRVEALSASGEHVSVTFTKTVRPVARAEVAERIRVERRAGLSLRQIARSLERDGIPAPRGGSTWVPNTVRRVAGS
jgi:hypothetical protein